MAEVIWPESLLEVLEEPPFREAELILKKADGLERFPRMYPVRTQGRFRGLRWFVAGNWLVYYRLLRATVYIRALWPARIP